MSGRLSSTSNNSRYIPTLTVLRDLEKGKGLTNLPELNRGYGVVKISQRRIFGLMITVKVCIVASLLSHHLKYIGSEPFRDEKKN